MSIMGCGQRTRTALVLLNIGLVGELGSNSLQCIAILSTANSCMVTVKPLKQSGRNSLGKMGTSWGDNLKEVM